MGIDENAVRVRFIPYTQTEKKKLMKLGVSRNPHDGGDEKTTRKGDGMAENENEEEGIRGRYH